MSDQDLNVKPEDIKIDEDGNIVIKNKEAAEKVKKALEDASVGDAVKIKILCCNVFC